MWKIDSNQNRIIDPHGKAYTVTELIKLAEAGKINQGASKDDAAQTHTYAQHSNNDQNWMGVLVDLLNKDLTQTTKIQPSPEADLTRIFVKQPDETTAQLVEFFSDGTSITSNRFALPRGRDGKPGFNDAYELYMSYEVNATSFVFDDYDSSYDHCFYFYFSLLGHKIVGRLEAPTGLDPNFLVSNVALDYATTSSVMMLFDANSKTLMSKNWSELGHVISKIDIYRKLGVNY